MRLLLFSFLVLCAFLPVQAQQSGFRAGLGIALNPAAIVVNNTDMFLPVGLMNFYIPLQLEPHLRLEPEIGILTIDDAIQEQQDRQENTWQYVRFGMGVFYMWETADVTRVYIGPRAGFLWYTVSRTTQAETSGTLSARQSSWYAGLCAGGEYFLSTHFSLGAELQLNYVSIGNAEQTPAPTVPAVTNRRIVTNNGLVSIRFYF